MQPPNDDQAQQLAFWAALASALLLLVLVGLTLANGVNQQTFEQVALPSDYAAALRAAGTSLRTIIAIDDVFIVAYVTATLFLVRALGSSLRDPAWLLVLFGGIFAGLLDLHENHHILSMLRGAELGVAPPLEQIESRATWSALKWLSGHASFALLGCLLEVRGLLRIPVRASLVLVQLVLGVATLVAVEPALLHGLLFARYAAVLSGFGLIAFLLSGEGRVRRAVDVVVGSGARA